MENNFYRDNFEQFLKDTTDNFRLYPSRKVWYGLYNDLHPGKKWPSTPVWILFISTLLFLGLPTNKELVPTLIYAKGSTGQRSVETTQKPALAKLNKSSKTSQALGKNNQASLGDNYFYQSLLISDNDLGYTNYISLSKNTEGKDMILEPSAMEEEIVRHDKKPVKKIYGLMIVEPDVNAQNENAAKNVSSLQKMKDRISYQIYATPSVGFRDISKNSDYTPPPGNSLMSSTISGEGIHSVEHTPAFNLEAGGNIFYNFSKIMRLKAGLQVNYTNYQISSSELMHPVSTTLMMNDPNNGFPIFVVRNSSLANSNGIYPKTLNNITYQLSMPLGADFKLAGRNNIELFAGATVQPTFVKAGNSYLLSADAKNYVSDESLLRRWNINGGIETYVSYKTKDGIILNVGPQFRYQFLSTYSNQFSYNERLYNLGIKMGITTNF